MFQYLKNHRKEIFVSVGWIGVSAVFFYSMLIYILNNNFFSWSFSFDSITNISLLTSIVMLFLMYILAKNSTGNFSQIVSIIIVTLFAILAVTSIFPDDDSVLRSVMSPVIFRISLCVFYFTPFIIWLFYPFQYFKANRKKVIK
jgi:hypothetical protein